MIVGRGMTGNSGMSPQLMMKSAACGRFKQVLLKRNEGEEWEELPIAFEKIDPVLRKFPAMLSLFDPVRKDQEKRFSFRAERGTQPWRSPIASFQRWPCTRHKGIAR